MKKRFIIYCLCAILTFGVVLTIVRYDAWFGNPVEPEYVISGRENCVMTFGEDGGLVMTWREAGDEVRTTGGSANFYCEELGRDGACSVCTQHILRRRDGACSVCTQQTSKKDEKRILRRYRKILVLGDIQDRDEEQAYVTQRLVRGIDSLHNPDVIVQLGDLIERPMQCAWDRFSIAFDSIDTVKPFIAILGNHDYYKGLKRHADVRPSLVFPYLRQTDIAACAHLTLCPDTLDLFIVDSNNDITNLFEQADWLDEELGRSKALHKVLLCHHPLHSTKFPLNNLFVRWAFSPVVKKHGVQLVLTGHEHTYSHTTHPYHQLVTHFSAKSYDGVSGRHYTIIEVKDNRLIVKLFDEANKIVESFSIFSEK